MQTSTLASLVAITLLISSANAVQPKTVAITTSKDNTLIQTSDGSLSLGGATHIYAGRVGPMGGGTIRRAVIAFDVAGAVPEGAEIVAVSFSLYVTNTQSGPQTTVLRRLLADWGEGTSDGFGGIGAPATPGDATWLHRFYPDVFWSSPGGDFSGTISASTVVDHSWEWYTWQSTPQLVADVQDWLDNPETNFGWVVVGNEGAVKTVKQFASKSAEQHLRPKLTITYEALTQCPGDIAGSGDGDPDGVVNVFDLLALLGAWGPCPAHPEDCRADLTGSSDGEPDGVVNVFDLLALLGQWGPCP